MKPVNLSKNLLLLIVSFAFFLAGFQIKSFGQDFSKEDPSSENWLKEYIDFPADFIFHRFDRYSKEDIVNFKEKFDGLKDLENDDEWEGIYYDDLSHLSFAQFRWKTNTGFLSFYFYTCRLELQSINYGQIAVSDDYIQIIPESAPNSPRKLLSLKKYVKVKWNDRQYLVEEPSLPAFAEKAAGIYVETEDVSSDNFMKWRNYWVKGDFMKDLTGLPEFPAKYKNLERKPITGKIIAASKGKIFEELELPNDYSSNMPILAYEITINVGKQNGLKKGMSFLITELDETFIITRVNQKSSIGILVRDVNEAKKEICHDENWDETVCPKISKDLKVSTQIGQFYF